MAYGKFDFKIRPDEKLGELLGTREPLSNGQMIKRLYEYIKAHGLLEK